MRSTQRWLVAAMAVSGGLAAVKLACSGDATAPAGTAGTAAGAGAAGVAGAGGTAGGGAAGGSGGASGSPVYDGGTWQPTGNPQWTSVPWVDCGAMYAVHPEHAAPPLVWKPCEADVPGCMRLVVNWDYAFPPLKTLLNSGGGVYETAAGTVVVLIINFKVGGPLTAAYIDAEKPIGAWKGPPGCRPWHLEWSTKHTCLSFGGLPPLKVGLVPPNDPYAAPLKTFTSLPDVPTACNDDLLFVRDTAQREWVHDLTTDQVNEITWPSGTPLEPRVHGQLALVPRWTGNDAGSTVIEGWLWQKPNSLTKLVDASPELIFDLRTDGTTLAWLQAAGTTTDWAPADVWASPFATQPSQLVPKKLGSVPMTTLSSSAAGIGGGYYAVIEPRVKQVGRLPNMPDSLVHLFRISDGRHWILPRFPDVSPAPKEGALTAPTALLEVGATDVWYIGGSQSSGTEWTIVRQRIDALGPGD